jgi:hypothetical protein
MALTLNSTTGISGVDGSASSPALQGSDSNTGINFASDTVNINTGGTTRATVNSAGNLGLGTTSPTASSGETTLNIYANEYPELHLTSSVTGTAAGDGTIISLNNDSSTIIRNQENSYIRFDTNGSNERMRIDSSGKFLVGKTSNGVGQVGAELRSGNSDYSVVATSNGHTALIVNRLSSTGELVQFRQANTTVGHISVTSSSTSYNTSSDYRLKENVVAISDGITRLKTLKPSRFNFIIDETNTLVDGFLAHEVTAVPEAISGTKDETQDILYTEEDTIPSGKKVGDVKETVPKYQGIDQSKLVPLLTAALQEAIAKIEVLETKVAALEAG